MTAPLVCLTPNMTLDRTLTLADLRPGGVHRATAVHLAAGGKGMNVARVARTLGVPVLACGALAGHTGRLVADLAAAEGVPAHWHWYAYGETRTCTLVLDPQGGDGTALNERGDPPAPAAWQQFLGAVPALVAQHGSRTVTVSGSLPPSVDLTVYRALLHTLTAQGVRVLVDTSGAALTAAIAAAPAVVKVNAAELAAALALPITTRAEAAAALHAVRAQGVAVACVTLGAGGALAADEHGMWHATAPSVPVQTTIGSGDALLAGLACAGQQGADLPAALRLGVACGTANTLRPGGGTVDAGDVDRLHAAVTVTRVP